MFARRGYNVQSLAVGNSEREGMSRITMVVPASSSGIANLIKQLNKLVYVEKVGAVGAVCWAASVANFQCCCSWHGCFTSLARLCTHRWLLHMPAPQQFSCLPHPAG